MSSLAGAACAPKVFRGAGTIRCCGSRPTRAAQLRLALLRLLLFEPFRFAFFFRLRFFRPAPAAP
jgi:hypothetical protein